MLESFELLDRDQIEGTGNVPELRVDSRNANRAPVVRDRARPDRARPSPTTHRSLSLSLSLFCEHALVRQATGIVIGETAIVGENCASPGVPIARKTGLDSRSQLFLLSRLGGSRRGRITSVIFFNSMRGSNDRTLRVRAQLSH